MSDEELCKALRSALWGQGHHINIKAADRIEQLEREVAVAIEVVSESGRKRGEAEAKLAKAVEALRKIGQCTHVDAFNSERTSYEAAIALAVLAELEAKDE